MADIMNPEARVIENLQDAGCGKEFIDSFMALSREGKEKELFVMLSRHRASLLECVHLNNKWIDRLDYLVYRMKKEAEIKDGVKG